MNKNDFMEKTNNLRSYPKHLRYTLFASEKIRQLRQKDFTFTHFIFEEMKEKGNKLYKKGKFRDAIDSYIEVY